MKRKTETKPSLGEHGASAKSGQKERSTNLLNDLVKLLLLLGVVEGVAEAVAAALADTDPQTDLQ